MNTDTVEGVVGLAFRRARYLQSARRMRLSISMIKRPQGSIHQAVEKSHARGKGNFKSGKKRFIFVINAHSEVDNNAVWSSAIVFHGLIVFRLNVPAIPASGKNDVR